MTLKEPKPKTIHKPIGTVIEAVKCHIFVLTCIYSSLLVSTIQWNLEFSETDQSDQCDGVSLAALLGSIAGLWISLVFSSKHLNELTVHVVLASNKEDQMEMSMLCATQKTDQILRTRDFYRTCSTSVHRVNSSPGNCDLFLYFCS